MDIREIKNLVRLIEKSQIDEIEIEEDGKKIRISKNLPGNHPETVYMQPAMSAPLQAPVQTPAPAAPVGGEVTTPVSSKDGNTIEIKAPMVGTFYRAPAPDAPPYVEIGDDVKPGQTLCILEAMKLMNEIECETSGKIIDILVENGEPVEFDQVLFIIEKN